MGRAVVYIGEGRRRGRGSSRRGFSSLLRVGCGRRLPGEMEEGDTVKLISAEGFEFVVDKKAAMVSQTIRNMLTSPGNFSEAQLGEVTFPEISTPILEKICQYFYWHLQFASGKESEFHIEPEITLELMMAANYLHT